MSRSFTHDLLIVGQGLAGSVLAETAMRRGLRVRTFDEPREGRASWVAAGLVNPVALRRTFLSWRAPELLPIAGAFYREAGLHLGREFWHPVPLVKVFPSAKEAGEWRVRMNDPEVGHYLSVETCTDPGLQRVDQPYGHGQVKRAAWVDMVGLLNAWRDRWKQEDILEERGVRPDDVRQVPGGVDLYGHTAPHLVWCEGPFARIKGSVPVRGERLTVRLPGLGLGVLVHRGGFILPLGGDDYRVGSTYDWDNVWSGPTAAARADLLRRLHKLLLHTPLEPEEAEAFHVVDHWAGVRPTTSDRRPLIGTIGPHQAVLNGLGSKGAMLAPWCAQHLLDHLLDGKPLDPEVDLARFA
ncbi:MAG: FAD-dependent oxidoreductase [Flavobacteriales bacterium]|nr:tRNA 5-methylaminomethyl-2-thiouridine biosynthesis bifunctional protein MnmC [Flavobacteriales bacterium]MCC6576174.1 FAD-dependent oxidoreductase [Flavobacteriales bacterium]NUQ13995.1 FAD-dependent oxidoreductase [Flavobacteriales bacterium]